MPFRSTTAQPLGPPLPTRVDREGAEFRANAAANDALVHELRARRAETSAGGDPAARERHRERGKLLVRERLERLLDPGAPFLELSPLAAFGLYGGEAPAAGIVTGVGRVAGREVVVVANDATVKGGTYFPLTVKKHLRAQEVAERNGLPCVYLVDSGGAFLPLQAELFPDRDGFGRIFFNQARMSAAGLPQVAAVMGSCTAGGAYVPAMSDEVVIVRGTGTIFIGGPPLVRAATGEEVTAEELGGADVHARLSGVADHLAKDDAHALALVREIVAGLGARPAWPWEAAEPEEPVHDPADLAGIVPSDVRRGVDAREIVGRIVDGSRLHEFKALYGPTLVCGLARIAGTPVGVVASNGVLHSESALKGTHFIELCCAREVPLLFLQNVPGFMVGRESEHGGMAKDGAKLVGAVASAAVPKLTVIVGGSFGAGNYAMCGRAYDPRFLWTWPNARIGVMGGAQAAQVLVSVREDALAREGRTLDDAEREALVRPVIERYEREGSPYYATARLWDDGIIEPGETRQVLTHALAAAAHAPGGPTRFGIFRM